MGAIQIVLLVLQLVPAIINVVKAIEQAIPGSGLGSEKLAAVKEILASAYENAEEIWPVLEKIIRILVDVFNKTGVFKK